MAIEKDNTSLPYLRLLFCLRKKFHKTIFEIVNAPNVPKQFHKTASDHQMSRKLQMHQIKLKPNNQVSE